MSIEVEGNTVTITEEDSKPEERAVFDLRNIPGLQKDIDIAAQEILAHVDDDAEGKCVLIIKLNVSRQDLHVTARVTVSLPMKIGFSDKEANAIEENGKLRLPEPKQRTIF